MTMILGLAAISYCRPEWFSDLGNPSLKGFVETQLLSVLGVIVTITLASAASLHLELNRLEDDTGEGFSEARWATKAYAYLLIALFGVAMALVVAKPLLATDAHWQAAFNGASIIIIALNGMALIDLTSAVFAIPSKRKAASGQST
ncbi:MAG: hypothetical protein J0J06_12625 [Sphingomonas sp.]|uniref:hypothetical protein n=1 Tax=Sphingomonas sp. TaxID=28214 RepID=UPI001ACB7304|nr:hypothetical protein [Sphingomonas sp.]MBN8816278.1 hypothetical protein [Sphingomonas sp.]